MCTIESENTCPGADNISIKMLIVCWEVTKLFRAYTCLRYHPTYFKRAKIFFLPKPLLDPPNSDRMETYCDIILFWKKNGEVTGKEHITPRYSFGYTRCAVFGALTKGLATNLVPCVVDYIEEAKIPSRASTLITLGVTRVFDAIMHSRLIWRIQ